MQPVPLRCPRGPRRESGEFDETERQRVHAVAESSWPGAVVEDVAEMRVAEAAGNRGALHAERRVRDFEHIFLGNRLPEAGPASAGLELGIGAEERRAAADA